MITNKDIRVDNGNLVINGDKYPLDGQSPETIMQIVEDNSDTTPTENSDVPVTSGGVFAADKDITDTIGDLTQTGVTGATVAAQLASLASNIKFKDVTIDPTTEGHTSPTQSGGGVYFEGLVSYQHIQLSKDKIIGVEVVDWNGIAKPICSLYLGSTGIGAFILDNNSIYVTSGTTVNITLRVFYTD